jgi:hypothetical protein
MKSNKQSIGMTFCKKTGKTVTKTYELMHVSDMFSAKLLIQKKKKKNIVFGF